MNTIDLIRPQLDRLQRVALPVGIVGLLLTVVGYFLSPSTFLHSYLVAYMFWFGVTMGSVAWLMIHQVAGAGAFFIARRLFEAASRNLPLMILFFVPLLIPFLGGQHPLYEWAHADIVRNDKILLSKSGYLNVPFFLIRVVFYFAVWSLMVYLLNRWSREQSDGCGIATHKLSMWSAVGLLTYVMTMTFAVVDWVMSLTPHWYSSLFGVIFIVGQGLSTLCLMHVIITYLTKGTTLTERVPQQYFRDLGNMTLAFTLLWAYMNFSQWVIIWSGNIGEEADWYVPRVQTSWVYVGAILIACHFVLPFLSLLSSSLKVKIQNLARLAVFILLMRFVDLHYYISATFLTDGAAFSNLADIGAPLGLGGIWLSMWAKQMKASRDLLAANDPRFIGTFEVPSSATAPVAPSGGVVSHG